MPKRRKGEPRFGQCVFCGALTGISRDHTPPRQLFPDPCPPGVNLITVPCCRRCNEGFKLDDDYFRQALALRADLADHPDVRALLAKVERDWHRPESIGLRSLIAKSLGRAAIRSEAGLFLGFAPTFSADHRRLSAVVERTVRGLTFHERRSRMPATTDVRARLADEARPDLLADVAEMLAGQGWREVLPGVFRYAVRFQSDEDKSCAGVWWLEFFGRVSFVAVAADPTMIDAPEDRGSGTALLPSKG